MTLSDDEGLALKLDFAESALRVHAKHRELERQRVFHDEEPCEHCNRLHTYKREMNERLQRLENWFDRGRK